MSHSKFNKKGISLYIKKTNPESKRYIKTCAICGCKGYNSSIDCDGFDDDPIRRVIRNELKRNFSMLHLFFLSDTQKRFLHARVKKLAHGFVRFIKFKFFHSSTSDSRSALSFILPRESRVLIVPTGAFRIFAVSSRLYPFI